MWFVLIPLCSTISLVMALAFCLCWKKKTEKNELLGLEGMVTQKNPDENVNHLPSVTPRCIVDGTISASGENTDANKRNVSVSNPRRSLPDIPSEGQERLQNDAVIWEPSGDNSSDLYASVEQYQNSSKRPMMANGLQARPSVSQHSSISQGDDAFSPYARVNYDQLQKQEHPYARLQNNSHIEESSSEEPSIRASLLRHENANHASTAGEPVAPPRSGRSSAQSGSGVDIPAASAVAGGIAASQELPYMTPPIAQTNFSGDSQDSSKGYTSISVREPLANIIAQTKEMNKMKRDLDPHYATVSDDSDDVYTTIPDPNNPVYTSGSETYARIPPLNVTVEVEVNPIPVSVQGNEDINAPQPPSVDSLRHVAHSHSRQASSSSSVANIGSPKPEKRQANSPLPPPPPRPASPDATTQEKIHTAKNLDDMYAKVYKNKKRPNTEELDAEKTNQKTPDESANKSSTSGAKPVEANKANPEPPKLGRSEIDGKPFRHEHNYETLRKSPRKSSDPGYEKIRRDKHDSISEPGYASINGPDSISGSDPGYEVLKQGVPIEIDPNYEELRHGSSSASDCGGYSRINVNNTIDGYSVVNKPANNGKSTTSSSYESDTRDFSFEEPNYESMPSTSLSDHNYAALKSTGSESDPNYESVSQNDPNYESVKYLAEDPPYERLQEQNSSSKSDKDYETVKGSEDLSKRKSEPPYERLSNELDSRTSGSVKVETDYEKVGNNVGADANGSTGLCAHSDSEDDVIIQV